MANALKGKTTVSITWIAPTKEGVDALNVFFDSHYEFMETKSYREGPLKLIQYVISESPEYDGIDEVWQGAFPKKTGRTLFNLFEIYETEEGLHHHWIETAPMADVMGEMEETYNIEVICFNQMKVRQSLWD